MNKIENTKTFKHKDINLTYVETEKGLWQSTMNPEELHKDITRAIPFLNFQIGIAGKPYGYHAGLTQGYSIISSIK